MFIRESFRSIFKIDLNSVLVTGGAGFIGSHFVNEFLNMGLTVHVVDNLSTGLKDNLPDHPNLNFYYGSIMDKLFLKQIPNVDLVIHLASIVGMIRAKKDSSLAYHTATVGTENVLNITKNAPTILFSSSSVYGLKNTSEKLSESTLIDQKNLLALDGGELGYANGKRDMEKLGLKYSANGRKIMIIRPFNVFGSKQIDEFGMVIPKFIKQAINDQPITIFGDGSQSRCFSNIETLVDCVFKLMDINDSWNLGNNIINVGSDESISINDLADKIIKYSESKSVKTYLPYNKIFPGQVDVYTRVPDTSHFHKLCGSVDWLPLKNTLIILINEKLRRRL